MTQRLAASILAAVIALAPLSGNAAPDELPSSDRAIAIVSLERDSLAPALSAKGLKLGTPIYLAIYKSEKQLELWAQGGDGKYKLFKTYPICAVSGGLGPKVAEGDNQAPEGFYEIGRDQLNPNSVFDLSLNLGFPNAYDRSKRHTGSALMIHGSCISVGCYAMTDPGIEEIYALVYSSLAAGAPSVPVHIFPFRMTALNMTEHARSPWYTFWSSLKPGYDAFAANGRPPKIDVMGGNYVVSPN